MLGHTYKMRNERRLPRATEACALVQFWRGAHVLQLLLLLRMTCCPQTASQCSVQGSFALLQPLHRPEPLQWLALAGGLPSQTLSLFLAAASGVLEVPPELLDVAS